MTSPGTPAPRDGRSRVSRAEAMAIDLGNEIERDRLQEGRRLGTKEDLRKRFGVAAATVNEALRILDIQGVVDARPGPGGGVFVAVPSPRPHVGAIELDLEAAATIAEWRDIRDALEPLVCRDAARRCGRRDAAELEQIVAEMAAATDDRPRFMSLNLELHRRIAAIGDNRPLTSLYVSVLDIVGDVARVGIEQDPLYDGPVNLEIHEQLVAAIVSGSTRDLNAAIRRHTPPSSAR